MIKERNKSQRPDIIITLCISAKINKRHKLQTRQQGLQGGETKAEMELQLIQNKIYEIRGQRVMLDFDLAEIYQVETRVLNQAVKRNTERFPYDFMFQLEREEWENLKSQIVISSWGGTRKLPFVFTEHGVTMLSSVLRSEVAIGISILIVRAFVAMRQLIQNTSATTDTQQLQNDVAELKQYIEEVFADYNDINEDTRLQLELINQTLAELQTTHKQQNKPRLQIGFAAEQYREQRTKSKDK